MPRLNDTCAYDGAPADPRFKLCPCCWGRVCGEIQDRVVAARDASLDSEPFQFAVEGAIKYLVWLDGQDS